MAKNVVLCLDGTGNQLKATGNTSVVRLYDLVSLEDLARQVAYYDPGVGTFGAQGAFLPISHWFSRVMGLAFGYGVRQNLADAYGYLMHTYEPGDRIFILGFSRGAFTARALAGMLNRAGLLRPGAGNLVPYAIDVYARRTQRWSSAHWHQTAKFSKTFSIEVDGTRSVPIHFLGLWDSVKAAGVLRRSMTWPDTRSLPNVAHVRHAVSIDEKRRPYREYLVEPDPDGPPMDLREVWFAGVHSDVGGSFDDDHRLADIALKWMVEEASAEGLRLDLDALPTVTAGSALGKVHRMSWPWALLTYRKRPIRSGSRVHASVRTRMESDRGYQLRTPEATIRWDDPDWTEGNI